MPVNSRIGSNCRVCCMITSLIALLGSRFSKFTGVFAAEVTPNLRMRSLLSADLVSVGVALSCTATGLQTTLGRE